VIIVNKNQEYKAKRASFDMPEYILDQIDAICKESFITRRKWFIDAALEKLEREKIDKIDRIVKK
jgi:hypothetical protein